MNYTDYIKPELLVIVPCLIGAGAIIKKTEKISDNYIPLILSAIGLILSCLYVFGIEGITMISTFTAFVQGIICAAAAVYGNQIYKQIKSS